MKIFKTPFKQRIMYILDKIFVRQRILLGHFLCDRVQGAERFWKKILMF